MSAGRRLASLAAGLVLLTALVLGLVLAWAVTEGIPAGTVLVVQGDRFELDRLAPAIAEHWLLATLLLILVAGALMAATPVVILLAVGLPLLASALSLALVLAPAGLLAWWLWRRASAPAAAPPPSQPGAQH